MTPTTLTEIKAAIENMPPINEYNHPEELSKEQAIAIAKSREWLPALVARVELLESQLMNAKDLAKQAITVAVMDLEYREEPVYGTHPLRHQCLWWKAKDFLSESEIQEDIKTSLEIFEKERHLYDQPKSP